MTNKKANPFEAYLESLERKIALNNATEHTHRSALEALLKELGGQGLVVTNEPKRRDCGAPDIIVSRGTIPLGYVETKDVGVDIAREESSEQLQRYRQALPNLILTDYFDFRWYVDGEMRLKASLPRDGHIKQGMDKASEVEELLIQFLQAQPIPIAKADDLASRMAKQAKLARAVIERILADKDNKGEIHGHMDAFQKTLLDTMTPPQFADMYAQTLAYGLFAARCNAPEKAFTRLLASSYLPNTNPFLRDMFYTIARPNLDERVAWVVDQLAELLACADMTAVLKDFGLKSRREDPVVHFYETFLEAYDPQMRELRGVYYTPEPVVGYIVRSIDELLKSRFNMPRGLATADKIRIPASNAQGQAEASEVHKLQILDPATGTGTFLYAVIARIRAYFKGNEGAWSGYVGTHLLPRLFGFELLMAPYAVAHLKLGLELADSGYDLSGNQRLGVFLTNSLEKAHGLDAQLSFGQWLADEANAASRIKREAPVMVVLGNPPYSGHSANKGKWIADLLRGMDGGQKTENYFECDGASLGERNPKWLNDDYVKFIRFAQWRIEQTGEGILGFVTNHGYLDNPTFRGMRESLLRSFDEIYVLDLHGNSKKQEKAPDGGKDENVFDIQQGVAIGLFVRRKKTSRAENHRARVFHADLYGTRETKYEYLNSESVESTAWQELAPQNPAYLFVPVDGALRDEYEQGWKITEAMPTNVSGFVTSRDKFAIAFDRDTLLARITAMRDTKLSDAEYADRYDVKDNRDWQLREA
ncbi:MAG: N-6 DNA methylase, partial [Zoogloeaceae bacterium]|nr:N-6 DNA methylase [Zoogloeaceae bacterium]